MAIEDGTQQENSAPAGRRKRWGMAADGDKHLLYEEAVQTPETDLDIIEKIYRKKRGRAFRSLREDFCGTAVLACAWVSRRPENTAMGVDLHAPTLEWGRRNHVRRLGSAGERVNLVCGDVLSVHRPKVDVAVALNFSYQVFKDRETLGRYFRNVHRSLAPDGIFVLDSFGGTDAMGTIEEERANGAIIRADGRRVPRFVYIWEQAFFNPIDHRIVCKIHFRFPDGSEWRDAFVYDWRLWMLPELHELLRDAGFRAVEVYAEGWKDESEVPDGIFRRRRWFENEAGWLAYVVAIR